MLSTNGKRKIPPKLKVIPTTKYSQSTPTSQLHLETSPLSPTGSTTSFISSVSWVAEKSAAELGSLLKNAYKSLREKEKNLLLAAEIGKSLLEHNQSLKSDYDKLLQNVRSYQGEVVLLDKNKPERISPLEKNNHSDEMRLISSKKAYDAIIESLERKNAEIQHMLDQTQQHSNLTEQSHEKKARKLESEIDILKNSLESATHKIQELEENRNQRQEQARRRCLDDKEIEQRETDDLALMEELTVKIDQLFSENKSLQSSKKSVQEKLCAALSDLDSLRMDFEKFELTQEGYANLQQAFQRQTIHIKELNESLEEHRAVLSRLRDKGYWTPQPSSPPSVVQEASTLSCFSKQSLLGELENAWQKNMTNTDISTSSLLHQSKSFSNLSGLSRIHDLASMTERNLTLFYNAPGDYALDTLLSTVGIENRACLAEAEALLTTGGENDAFDFLFNKNMNEDDNQIYDIYPPCVVYTESTNEDDNEEKLPKGLVNRIMYQIRSLFRSVFRWCRFAIILATAILINLWKGPDLIMDK
ncbi:hypothetical protein K501DRAFT_264722 [Backusella circina FSU 941]|nr:hypothetical protein K501DRAFT_264722 [Backusella circina FSU 941]